MEKTISTQELISIIVPVYKAEKYLRRCVNSILKQTYRNLEIILVDDGSPDKSPQICDKYAKKDKRIRVIHQKNGGICVARNNGIKIAGGGCLTFIDDDDWIPPQAIETLFRRMTDTEADLVCGRNIDVRRIPNVGGQSNFPDISFCLEDIVARNETIPIPSITPWAKLYRKEIILDNRIFFDPQVPYAEDAYFLYRYMKCCKKITLIPQTVYYYSKILAFSGMNIYHKNLHFCRSTALDARIALYNGNIPIEEQVNIVEDFNDAMMYYVFHLLQEEATEKLEETCKLYADKLQYVTEEAENHSVGWKMKNYLTCKKYIQKNDMAALYDFYRRQAVHGESSFKRGLKKAERKFLCPIYRFLIYKLNLFYHH